MPELVKPDHIYHCTGGTTLFYQVKPVSAFLLSLATWGIYAYWWHYQNWRLIKKNAESAISPLARSLLHPLFAYYLYDQVSETAMSLGIRGAMLLRVLGVLHVPMILTYFQRSHTLFPVTVLALHALSAFDLVYVQIKVVQINRALGLAAKTRFNLIDLLALIAIVGQGLFFFLVYV